LAASCLSGVACAAILAWLAPDLAPDMRAPLLGGVLVYSVLSGLAWVGSARSPFPIRATLGVLALGAVLLCGLVAVALRDGVRDPALGFCAVVVCLVGAIAGIRSGLAIGSLTLLQLAGLAWAESSGALPAAPAGAAPIGFALAYQALIVVCAMCGGALIDRVLDHYLRQTAEREQRFRGLLHIAADWYWEQDAQFRFTEIVEARENTSGIARDKRLNRTPWQISEMGLTPDELDAHRADLEAHRRFSGLLVRRRDERGRPRVHSVSGEPRFDAAGVFVGYWGVARDVTSEVRAQRLITASETRYRELFTRSPSPLFLQRRGVIFDANEAAARLFGFEHAAAMNGTLALDLFADGAMRDKAARRIAHMDSLKVGEALPVADFQTISLDGRLLSLQAAAVRVETTGGPATLSIIYDVTARQAAENALRRSEALLSHIFTTSLDLISVTEMETGRFTIVNPAFTRLLGFSAEEAIGRSSLELGTWHRAEDRDRLIAAIRQDGSVHDWPTVFVAKSGARVQMQVSAAHFVLDDRDYIVVNGRDVTQSERTRLEHAAILERASIGIAFTRDRRFVQANPYFERMFGWEVGALKDQPGSVVWSTEADYAEIGRLAGPLLSAGKSFETECEMQRADRSRFWCRLLAQPVDLNDPSLGGTIWIAADVTERRRLDQALASARDAAEAASRAKSAFLANMSHEIRTPLNGLLGLARLTLQPGVDEARKRQYLAQILDSGQTLAGIISDILDVSKIEAGKIALEDLPFDLRGELRAMHHAYQALAEAKGLELHLQMDAALPATVRGDPVRVRQILSNFITNALKFTERGSVRIEAGLTARGWQRLAVTDTGVGVSQEVRERLFTPFSQGDSSTTRRYGGTGLGLSICRQLAQLMGGNVGVDSTPGAGSTFWAELPLPNALAPLEPHAGEARELEQLHGARVLMVEDNPVNMMIAVAMLESWGVVVAQAGDGRAAIDAIERAATDGRPFDAVLMDVQMPTMSGHEAARALRQRYPAAQLPIIALTAAALVSERDEALAAGMDAFLTKPIDAAQLRQTLARHARPREAQSR
ncbi:MAG TPA: PAS domain S-box protein, partial [Burkholderiaceae bacterium]|nr:PAS domain S-box protein [Burkholderiaceae bacterium]